MSRQSLSFRRDPYRLRSLGPSVRAPPPSPPPTKCETVLPPSSKENSLTFTLDEGTLFLRRSREPTFYVHFLHEEGSVLFFLFPGTGAKAARNKRDGLCEDELKR